ncbi:MAG TPA: hypothetical protein PKJ16_06285 [Spirochaetota bacterium]|nr:hypothetical protein [Spirochaetota bacterium]HOS39708.1 hypothetical protein [Spirochaetota bacterium]
MPSSLTASLTALTILLALCSAALAQPKDPEAPRAPVVVDEKAGAKKERAANQPEKRADLYAYSVKALRADGRSVEGTADLASPSITFTHVKGGVSYEKTVRWDDVESIRAVEWKPVGHDKTSAKETQPVFFYPSRWKLVLKSGKLYDFTGQIALFNKIVVKNRDGSAAVYTYFVDYWKRTGTRSGMWENARSTDFDHPRRHPDRSACVQVRFR